MDGHTRTCSVCVVACFQVVGYTLKEAKRDGIGRLRVIERDDACFACVCAFVVRTGVTVAAAAAGFDLMVGVFLRVTTMTMTLAPLPVCLLCLLF